MLQRNGMVAEDQTLNFINGQSAGQIVMTSNAAAKVKALGIDPAPLLVRHLNFDWGDMPPEDVEQNNMLVKQKGMVMSSYKVAGLEIWIITDNGHEVTTILLPEDY